MRTHINMSTNIGIITNKDTITNMDQNIEINLIYCMYKKTLKENKIVKEKLNVEMHKSKRKYVQS